MSERETDKLPEIAAEYINSVIKNVKYRKKIRNEVRDELTDHFIDALHGCQNDQDRQKRAEELIAGFGDIKLLGQLIRRGKKRCRPLWRTAVVRAFQCAGALLILLVLYIGWFFTGKPMITTNYLEVMNNNVRPVADDSLNASPLYEQAIKLYVAPGKLKKEEPLVGMGLPGPEGGVTEPETHIAEVDFDTSPRSYTELSEQERSILTEWLVKNEETIDLVRQGNEKPYYWRTYSNGQGTSELIAVLLPNLSEFKMLSYLLCWRAMRDAESGNYEAAFDAALASYRLGMHLRNKNVLIEQLVAVAIEANSTKTIRLLLSDYSDKMDGSMLSAVRNEWASIIGNENFIISFEGEKLFMYDEVQRSFTQTRIGKSHIYLQRVGQLAPMVGAFNEKEFLKQWFHILFTHPDRDETLAAVEEFYAAMDEFAKYSPAQLRQKGIDVNKRLEELIKGNLLLELMTPALEKVVQLSYRNKADSEAMLAILAIFEYQKQNKTLPQTLNTLVETGVLKAVPMDPYSDQPLVYRQTKDGFTLYSVGPNLKDNGGTPGTHGQGSQSLWAEDRMEKDQMISGGDAVFWPVP